MAQNVLQSKTKYFNDPCEFITFIRDSRNIVKDIHLIKNDFAKVIYTPEETFATIPKNVNVCIASFLTSYARMHLYSLLEYLQERVIYFDTDSCVYLDKERPNHEKEQFENPDIRIGDKLGELTDELEEGEYITEFASGGPKNYGFVTSKGVHKMVVKGICVGKFSNILTFQTLKDMILKEGEHVTNVTEPFELRTDANKAMVKTVPLTKSYQIVYTKRRIVCDVDGNAIHTVPYGWIDDK